MPSALPRPMLARGGPIPTRGGWAFEVKWDGFRALVRTDADFTVRSRRGWNMTEHQDGAARRSDLFARVARQALTPAAERFDFLLIED